MKTIATALVLSLATAAGAADYSEPGPHVTGWSRVEIARTNGTTFSALVFYPATAPGQNAPPDRQGAPRPAVSFGHGFLCSPTFYTGTLRHLASWGMIVIATESGLELFPSHQDYADDLRECLYWLVAESGRAGGFWSGLVRADRLGLSGHSMGGGAAFLAAADDPSFLAVGTLAPAETWPSAIDAIGRVTRPVGIIAGEEDAITPPPWHALPLYENARAPKLLAMLRGGSHCGFLDVPLPDAVCDEGTTPRSAQLSRSHAALTAFFRAYLSEDPVAAGFLWGGGIELNPNYGVTADPGFTMSPYCQTKEVGPGEYATFQVTISNGLDHATHFTLRSGGGTALPWETTTVVGPLPPGGTATASCTIGLPGDLRTAHRILKTGTFPQSTPQEDFVVLRLARKAPAVRAVEAAPAKRPLGTVRRAR